MKLPPPTTPIRLNLAPMVDVTMCLLIFFMVAAKMVEQENSDVSLPYARSAQDVDKQELGNRFVVNVIDLSAVGGEGVAYVVQGKQMSLTTLLEQLKVVRQHDPEVNCVIRADRSLPYNYVQAVMVGCARSNIYKITFGAIPRAEGGG